MKKSLITVLALGAVLALVACSKQKVDADKAAEQAAELIQPVARVEMAVPVATSSEPKSGEEIVKAVCAASCHGPTGIPQAPKMGDKAAWAPRIALGMDALYKSALNGKNNIMPARGGQVGLSDAEVKSAVDYLVKQAK